MRSFAIAAEGAVDLVGTSRLQEVKLHAQCPGRDLRLSSLDSLEDGIGRIPQGGHSGDLGKGFLEQL